MKRWFLTIACATAFTVAACGGGNGTPRRADGNSDVYDRIEASTSCDSLQSDFDSAMNNAEARPSGDRLRAISLSYAEAAEARRKKLGCR